MTTTNGDGVWVFRKTLGSGNVVEAAFSKDDSYVISKYVFCVPRYQGYLNTGFCGVNIATVTRPGSGWVEIKEEESSSALTSESPAPAVPLVYSFDVAADECRDHGAELESSYCCTTDDCNAICCVGELPVNSDCEPDAEESIDEYVARIDEGVVPDVDPRDAEIAELMRDVRRSDNLFVLKTESCIQKDAELSLYRQFHRDAVAAHAEASPNRVEIMFGRACDKLRAGLRESGAAPKEEESLSSQVKMEAVPT